MSENVILAYRAIHVEDVVETARQKHLVQNKYVGFVTDHYKVEIARAQALLADREASANVYDLCKMVSRNMKPLVDTHAEVVRAGRAAMIKEVAEVAMEDDDMRKNRKQKKKMREHMRQLRMKGRQE